MSKRIKTEHVAVYYKKIPTSNDRSTEGEAHIIVFTERHYYFFGLWHWDVRYSYSLSGMKVRYYEPTNRANLGYNSAAAWSLTYESAREFFDECDNAFKVTYNEL